MHLFTLLSLSTPAADAARLVFNDEMVICCDWSPPPPVYFVVVPLPRDADAPSSGRRPRRAMDRFLRAVSAFETTRFDEASVLLPPMEAVPDGPYREAVTYLRAALVDKIGSREDAAEAWAGVEGSLRPIARLQLWACLGDLAIESKRPILDVAVEYLARHPTEDGGPWLGELAIWLRGYTASDVAQVADAALARAVEPDLAARVEHVRDDALAGRPPDEVDEQFDPAFLRKVIDQHADDVLACTKLGDQDGGAISVEIDIRDGEPVTAAGDGAIGACIADRALSWQFPVESSGVARATWFLVPFPAR